MKQLFIILSIGFCASCSQQTGNKINHDTPAIDSLKKQTEKIKPGLGELMMGIQTHHAKVWFAGINNNWPLADYEMSELKEMFGQAKEIETDRPEIKTLPMIYPSIDSMNAAIAHKDIAAFKKSFQLLTENCNTCHTINHFEFNVITIPSAPPVTDQDFKAH